MTDLKEIQKEVFLNKVAHGFNTTNIEKEFLLLYGEVAEAFTAYKNGEALGEELADVAIYLLGLSEILKVDLGTEIEKKMAVNKKESIEKTGWAMQIVLIRFFC